MRYFLKIIFLVVVVLSFQIKLFAEENAVLEQIESIQQDLKTLEKAVYSGNSITTENSSNSSFSEDVLTRHLLKLSDIEEQFQELTNKFEEINFKIDKLSSRISKIQSDNQIRFQDLEKSGLTSQQNVSTGEQTVKKLPGSSEAQDLGRISEQDLEDAKMTQQTQSIDSTSSVTTEKFTSDQKILPDDIPEKQYEFAISFLKVGDYETAELALREFVDKNEKHKLAGNAQYWYAETFRIRQLYQDAATAYLDSYQKYPDSPKAPVNLLKLGVSLVRIGEKDQGCLMISGVTKEYPKASQSVLQKAKYEEKKFDCPTSKT